MLSFKDSDILCNKFLILSINFFCYNFAVRKKYNCPLIIIYVDEEIKYRIYFIIRDINAFICVWPL